MRNRDGEDSDGDQQRGSVRFHHQQQHHLHHQGDHPSALRDRERVLDTEDASRGPLSGIFRLTDSPRVIKRLNECERAGKRKKDEPVAPTPQQTTKTSQVRAFFSSFFLFFYSFCNFAHAPFTVRGHHSRGSRTELAAEQLFRRLVFYQDHRRYTRGRAERLHLQTSLSLCNLLDLHRLCQLLDRSASTEPIASSLIAHATSPFACSSSCFVQTRPPPHPLTHSFIRM